MPTVSFVLGYIVLWPSVLTFFVSTAKINPSRPPWIVAVSVEFGREMTARPVVNTTHLVNWEIRNQLPSTLERDESRNVTRRKRTRLAHGGANDRKGGRTARQEHCEIRHRTGGVTKYSSSPLSHPIGRLQPQTYPLDSTAQMAHLVASIQVLTGHWQRRLL